jgi:nitrogen PTS system EIIA component
MKLVDVLKKECVILNLNSKNKLEVIKEISDRIASIYTNINVERLVEVLIEREKLCSTAVDAGVAIPHGKLSGLGNIITAFGRSLEGIDFESLDGKPTHFFILLIAPENSAGAHLKLLARISRIFKDSDLRSRIMEAKSQIEIYETIIEEDERH